MATLLKTESCFQKQRQTIQGKIADYFDVNNKPTELPDLRCVHICHMVVGEGPRFWL